jgi:hypothetical protein
VPDTELAEDDGLRPWQRPLTDEQIVRLQAEFAAHRVFIERIWGRA